MKGRIRAQVWWRGTAVCALGFGLLAAGCAQLEPVAGKTADNAKGILGTVWRPANKGASAEQQPQQQQPASRSGSVSKPTRSRAATPPPPASTKKRDEEKEPSLGGAERPGDF